MAVFDVVLSWVVMIVGVSYSFSTAYRLLTAFTVPCGEIHCCFPNAKISPDMVYKVHKNVCDVKHLAFEHPKFKANKKGLSGSNS